MNPLISRSILFSLVAGFSLFTPATAQLKTKPKEPCPDKKTYIGRYRNLLYGFSITIPSGLKGYWNSAACSPAGDDCICFTDHGRVIPLAGEAAIDAFVGYQMEFDWSLINYERNTVLSLAKEKSVDHVKLLRSGWVRLDKLKAWRFRVEFLRDNKTFITDHLLALHKGVLYELILRTRANRYQTDRIPFQKIIHSWRLTPRIE
jgi:hypothetical protein